MPTRLFGWTVGVTLSACFVAFSQAGETDVKPAPAPVAPAAVLPGHSLHGEAFNEGPRQKAYLMGGTGAVHFPITTRVPQAQQFFDQGVGQLHGFWYFEAERSFRQVAALDPDCAMAYWGMAMANVNNEKRAREFLKKAAEKKAQASAREIAWIDALTASHTGDDNTERRKKYIRDLETLVQDDPNDIEAKAFLALQIWSNGSWQTEKSKQLPIASHQAVDALLDQVLQSQPMHPAHHYRIHLWDDEKPARALVSASLNGQSSPAIAHMWHMPGHTYSNLHRYADAAWQQEASARVDHAHMIRDGVLPDQIHNYAHNNEWLIRNLAYVGRVQDALSLAKNMIELPRHPQFNTPEKGSAKFGRQRLLDVLAQYEAWPTILEISKTAYFEPLKGDEDQLERARILGLAAFGEKRLEEGQQQIATLDALLKQRRTARYAAADEAEAKARKEKKRDKEIDQAVAAALGSHRGKIDDVEEALTELKGYAALAAGQSGLARIEFEKLLEAPSVRDDQLARALLDSGNTVQAEKLARRAVEKGPGEVYPLATLVDVLYRTGNKEEAKSEFNRLRTLAADADWEPPVFQRLRPTAQEFGFPADWRGPREASGDVGQRPDLSRLGPFRWQPTPAASWNLSDGDGNALTLEQFRGKPVVVIFYLGSGCLHCVEQLQKFAPLTSDFASQGISLVAISSESLDSLKASRAKLGASESIRFPLVADPSLSVFKSYRVFDDFENTPLHGTFLIDAEGLVRWHDINYKPFLDARFVLDEARRQFGLR